MSAYADPKDPALPKRDFEISLSDTALVVVDPQIDFLREDGVAWPVVKESVQEQGVVENLLQLFRAADQVGMATLVSPHYYYPQDHRWRFEGTLEKVMHDIHMFDRPGPLDLAGFDDSGADFMPVLKPFIMNGRTIIASPHKIYGPENNDLALQLRKLGIDNVILAGMSSNLCIESHMRHLIESGFQVGIVRDGTAGAKVPEGDGYLASLINFRMIANALWWTEDISARIRKLAPKT